MAFIKDAVKCACGCGIVLIIVLGSSIWCIHVNSGNVTQTTDWAEPQEWRLATCKVLATGVSCVDRDAHTTCGGFGGNGTLKKVGSEGTVVFDFTDIAVCPGSYWCAKEGDMCKCDGQVTYAPELFDGYGYTLADNDASLRISVSGSIKCGTDGNGIALVDPRPYWVKHCWCTPRAIYEHTHRNGEPYRSPYKCTKEAQQDFNNDISNKYVYQQPANMARRLHGEPPVAAPVADEDDGELDAWLGDEDTHEDKQTPLEEQQRRLTTHTPRRRRTYHYTPWALVEVPPEEDDGFGDRESQEKVLTCAYEFGAPVFSYGDYSSDGPYSGWIGDNLKSAKLATSVAQAWAKDSENQCWVRTVGQSAKDTCAVSMEPLTALVDRRQRALETSNNLLWFSSIALVILVLGTVGLLWHYRSSTGQRGQSLLDIAME